MSHQPPSSDTNFSNHLIRALGEDDRARLISHLEPIDLPFEMGLETAEQEITHAYFPESGIASTVNPKDDDDPNEIEVGMIGREGCTGLPLILGNHTAINTIYMQGEGRGHRIRAETFRDLMDASRSMHNLLLRWVQVFLCQVTETAISNGRYTIEDRLARWLLMAQDRIDSVELPLTHDFLSIMLGVRRAGVTDALHALAGRGLLRSGRGHIVVLDRQGLKELASGYGKAEAVHRRLIHGEETEAVK